MSNKQYWTQKDAAAQYAKEHTEEMDKKYAAATEMTVKETKVYDESFIPHIQENYSNIHIVDMDTVSAIFDFAKGDNKMAALNFASYKEPGGMFLKGSTAQEESLCRESNLYNVLREFTDGFYRKNNQDKNKALYHSRALYSPGVLFKRMISETDYQAVFCDIITCAAPNKKAAQKYCNITDEENLIALRERIYYVLSIAAENQVDTLILGAYGCGVFGQSATEVAMVFKEFLKLFRLSFKQIVFAIPKKDDGNFDSFLRVFKMGKF